MNKAFFFGLTIFLFSGMALNAQDFETLTPQELVTQFRAIAEQEKRETDSLVALYNIPRIVYYEGGSVGYLQRITNGFPEYYTTLNVNAAKTISTNKVWPSAGLGYSLTGAGINIGIWDAGLVRMTHQEFLPGQIINKTGGAISNYHSTHVGCTMVGQGMAQSNYKAKGMASGANLISYQFPIAEDVSSISEAAKNGLTISNHSYGNKNGWVKQSDGLGSYFWIWSGEIEINQNEDYKYGFYNEYSSNRIDQIAAINPYYLGVWAAGNDRNPATIPPSSNFPHRHYAGIGLDPSTFTDSHEINGGSDGYDCLSSSSVAKNSLVVGAVNALPNGYGSPSDVIMSTFSSWGPTDDGRIKPDIVADGVHLYSAITTDQDSDTTHDYNGGTSMAAPTVTGSIALLLQHQQNLHGSKKLLSSTMKAIIIHTADEAGDAPGPDYKFGWGLMNTKKAADLMQQNYNNHGGNIYEMVLNYTQPIEFTVKAKGSEPLKVTICWVDLWATVNGYKIIDVLNNRTSTLVNDLDLRLISSGSTIFSPYVLDFSNPANPATTGDNNLDNVEQVFISSPDNDYYTIRIYSHDNKFLLSKGLQTFSLVVTGVEEATIGVDQKLSSNASYGKVKLWEGTAFNSGITVPFQATVIKSSKTALKADQALTPTNEKYNFWTSRENVLNHNVPNYDLSTTFTARLKSANNATLQASLMEVNYTGGSVSFQDPWLADYPDPLFNRELRNRAMTAPFKSVAASTNNLGRTSVFKGVFINQYDPDVTWRGSYYSGQADAVQNLNGLASSFQNWSGQNVVFQNSSALQSGLYFTNDNATITANYKAMLASKTVGWVTSNQFVSENSTASVMYVSDGKLWLHRENGADKKEILVSNSAVNSYSVAANGTNRYWVLNNGTTTPVSGYELNGVTSVATVPALSGLTSSNRIEIVWVNSTTPKLALITKIGSTIYKSIGTLTAGVVTWGSWTSLTVGANAIQVAGNGNLAYVAWIQGSSIFGYKLKTDGTWSSAKVITTSSSGSFTSLATAVDPNGNLYLTLVRANTQTQKKDLGEGAWYFNETTKPFTVLSTSGTYGDFTAVSLACEGTKRLASVGVSSYNPYYSYYLWKHDGTSWTQETTPFATVPQKLLNNEVDFYPAEISHSSSLNLLTLNLVGWGNGQNTEKITTGTNEQPVLSISGVQLTDTLVYNVNMDPAIVDSIIIDTLGVWSIAVKGAGFVTETVNDLKLFGSSELVVTTSDCGTSRVIRFIPDLTKWDVWVVDPSGNKVRMNKDGSRSESGSENSKNLVEVYPNPFNPETRINVRLIEPAELHVRVYNVVGQLVADLANGQHDKGDYSFRFDGKNFASGTYFYRVEIGNEVKTGKLQLLK